jgi:hypothetical protein
MIITRGVNQALFFCQAIVDAWPWLYFWYSLALTAEPLGSPCAITSSQSTAPSTTFRAWQTSQDLFRS